MSATTGYTARTLSTLGYSAEGPSSKLGPFGFQRREPGPNDVLIDISYCGVCLSDIHKARNSSRLVKRPDFPFDRAGRVEVCPKISETVRKEAPTHEPRASKRLNTFFSNENSLSTAGSRYYPPLSARL
jgi:hypothetical protein